MQLKGNHTDRYYWAIEINGIPLKIRTMHYYNENRYNLKYPYTDFQYAEAEKKDHDKQKEIFIDIINKINE